MERLDDCDQASRDYAVGRIYGGRYRCALDTAGGEPPVICGALGTFIESLAARADGVENFATFWAGFDDARLAVLWGAVVRRGAGHE